LQTPAVLHLSAHPLEATQDVKRDPFSYSIIYAVYLNYTKQKIILRYKFGVSIVYLVMLRNVLVNNH